MISKSILKRKPFASQKVRRRWVIAYFVAFGLMFIINALDLEFLIEHNLVWSWVLIGVLWLSAVLYIVASVRGLSMFHKSEYRDMTIMPVQMLDERQVLVRYRASELCFEIMKFLFALTAIYIYFVPLLHLPLPTYEAVRRLFMFSLFFIGSLRAAMITWLEPDPIEEAPTF